MASRYRGVSGSLLPALPPAVTGLSPIVSPKPAAQLLLPDVHLFLSACRRRFFPSQWSSQTWVALWQRWSIRTLSARVPEGHFFSHRQVHQHLYQAHLHPVDNCVSDPFSPDLGHLPHHDGQVMSAPGSAVSLLVSTAVASACFAPIAEVGVVPPCPGADLATVGIGAGRVGRFVLQGLDMKRGPATDRFFCACPQVQKMMSLQLEMKVPAQIMCWNFLLAAVPAPTHVSRSSQSPGPLNPRVRACRLSSSTGLSSDPHNESPPFSD